MTPNHQAFRWNA